MSDVKSKPGNADDGLDRTGADPEAPGKSREAVRPARVHRLRIVPVLVTLQAIIAAAVMTWAIWEAYMA